MTETNSGRPPVSRLIVACLALALAAPGFPVAAQSHRAAAAVIDGDTLEVAGAIVRLYGIDAPELGRFCLNAGKRYRCGYEAAQKLRRFVAKEPVACRAAPLDQSDEGQICDAGPVDLAEAMLLQGYAVALSSAPPRYRRAESAPRRGSLGIWRGDFVAPSEWRAGRRLEAGAGETLQVCDVKGLVGDKFPKILPRFSENS